MSKNFIFKHSDLTHLVFNKEGLVTSIGLKKGACIVQTPDLTIHSFDLVLQNRHVVYKHEINILGLELSKVRHMAVSRGRMLGHEAGLVKHKSKLSTPKMEFESKLPYVVSEDFEVKLV